MSSKVYYTNGAVAASVTPVLFTDPSTGQATDPSSVTCVVTDPAGTITSYAYTAGNSGLNEVIRGSQGNYTLTVDGLTVSGLYTFTWVGTGNGIQQVTPGTFRLMPLSDAGLGMTGWYCGMEELKSRLTIKPNDTSSDYEIQLAIQNASNWVTNYCGQHFYKLTEARTYMPTNIWEMEIDPLCSDPALISTISVDLDYDGDGVFEKHWVYNQDYILKLGKSYDSGQDTYNRNAGGVPKPFKQLQALMFQLGNPSPGGGWLPFIWPYTHLDRVKITGTWGWDQTPPNVAQATLMLAVDLFKSKDAPFGVTGMGDLGIVKVQSNPWVVELLRPYLNTRRKVGV